MTAKDFRIRCPMCKGTIVIDSRTGHIIRHHEPGRVDEDGDEEKPDPALFDDALGKVKKTRDEGDTVFDGALDKMKKRNQGLDEAFKAAREKAKKKGDKIDPKDRPDFWD